MVSIRRKLGAFVAAVAIAAVMVAVPTTAHAQGKKTGSLEGFCAQLQSTIDYLYTLDQNLAVQLTIASLEATQGAYCQ